MNTLSMLSVLDVPNSELRDCILTADTLMSSVFKDCMVDCTASSKKSSSLVQTGTQDNIIFKQLNKHQLPC